MNRLLLLAILLLLTSGCQNSAQLEALNQSFEQGYRTLTRPVREQAKPVYLARWDSLLKTYRLQLEQTTPRGERAEQLWQNLRQRLLVFEDQIQAYREQPALYNLGGQCQAVLSQTERPLPARLRQILNQLQRAAPYYQAAKGNLQQFSAAAAQLGIKKQQKGQRFLQGALIDSLSAADMPADTVKAIRNAAREAALAMGTYQSYLRQ